MINDKLMRVAVQVQPNVPIGQNPMIRLVCPTQDGRSMLYVMTRENADQLLTDLQEALRQVDEREAS
jgi:hypothetical protein